LLNDALNDSTTPSRTSTPQIAPKPIVYNKSKKRVRIEGSDDEDTPAAKKKVDLGAAIIALTSEMAIARQSKSEQSRAVELLETAYGKRLDMMVFIQGCTFFEDISKARIFLSIIDVERRDRWLEISLNVELN
jgi:hypothetical protein